MPVRLEAAYEGDKVSLTARTGPVPVKLLPRERAKKLERQEERGLKRLWKRWPRPLVKLMAENAWRAAMALRPYVAVEKLRVRVTAGGDDPYNAVMAYGWAGVLLEALGAWVPNADLSVRADLDGGPSAFEGHVCLRARMGNLIGAAVSFGTGFLRGYFLYKRNAKREEYAANGRTSGE